MNLLIINDLKKKSKKCKKMLHVLKNFVYLHHQTTKCSYMETTKKSPIDIAAKQLWQQICELQNLLCEDIHDDTSAQFYCEFLKKSSEFARYIDKNFYNND